MIYQGIDMENWKKKLVKETVNVWRNTDGISLADIQRYISSYQFISDCMNNSLTGFEKWSNCLDDITIINEK